jgi:hypothetical protein
MRSCATANKKQQGVSQHGSVFDKRWAHLIDGQSLSFPILVGMKNCFGAGAHHQKYSVKLSGMREFDASKIRIDFVQACVPVCTLFHLLSC